MKLPISQTVLPYKRNIVIKKPLIFVPSMKCLFNYAFDFNAKKEYERKRIEKRIKYYDYILKKMT